MKLLICDDEKTILNGLQHILDWNNLGFTEILTANNGSLALDTILQQKPDLILIDINMPILSGLDVITAARNEGFEGHFIIISGFSEFAYAQKAIALNVVSYLCKPIDDEELLKSVEEIIVKINTSSYKYDLITTYETIAIKEYLFSTLDSYNSNLNSFGLSPNDSYQLIAYEKFYQKDFSATDSFKELLGVSDKIKYTSLRKDNLNLIVLLGEESINLVSRTTKYYTAAFQKNSLLDNTFLYFGEVLKGLENLPYSYNAIKSLVLERFFCSPDEHFLDYTQLEQKKLTNISKLASPSDYAELLFKDIQAVNVDTLKITLTQLSTQIKSSSLNEEKCKRYLVDMFLHTKNKINLYYLDIPLLTSSFTNIAIDIETKIFLYEIIDYIHTQLTIVINTVSKHSKDTFIYDVIDYIDKNYDKDLKIKIIAEHFNYNCSYFGRLFNKSFNCSFNKYIEIVRIEKSKKLLENENLKVYEICESVGYNNVDYFHKKFKSIVGISPIEYRKKLYNEN